ncbi:hypothetical protein Taro_031838 [Colocasia esculenta]|uniref:Reverse transcriptase zinc-binding domain-containing protein n=1 Tax=Colocasia esculenta TaxID=4460 RepID=A0A843VJU3_COLES|nr:hypothetical protein [Colocasia esculenta]
MLSPKAPASTATKIKEVTGFSRQPDTLIYLGVPLKVGRLSSVDYSYLIDKVNGKFLAWKSKLLSQAGRITLINSVISSLPIYITTASYIPKSIISYIERASAVFFLDGANGSHRRHWVAWPLIQKSVTKGGLGVRSLWHVQITLAIKQLWTLTQSSSIWATYARRRYSLHHVSSIPGIPKVIYMQDMEVLKDNTRWVHGNGRSIRILHDTWIGETPLRDLIHTNNMEEETSLSDVVSDISHPLRSSIPQYLMEGLELSSEEDKCIWAASNNGTFSTKSVYNLIRPKGVHRPALSNLWHNSFYRRASLFSWKILHRAVPVDARISKIGIPMVSCCSCCHLHASEDLDHLFINSDLAISLWHWIYPLVSPKVTLHSHITARLWSFLQDSNTR